MIEYFAVRLGNNAHGGWSRGNASARPAEKSDRMLFATRQGAHEDAAKWPDMWHARLVKVRRKEAKAPAERTTTLEMGPCRLLCMTDATTVAAAVRQNLEDAVRSTVWIRIERTWP